MSKFPLKTRIFEIVEFFSISQKHEKNICNLGTFLADFLGTFFPTRYIFFFPDRLNQSGGKKMYRVRYKLGQHRALPPRAQRGASEHCAWTVDNYFLQFTPTSCNAHLGSVRPQRTQIRCRKNSTHACHVMNIHVCMCTHTCNMLLCVCVFFFSCQLSLSLSLSRCHALHTQLLSLFSLPPLQ